MTLFFSLSLSPSFRKHHLKRVSRRLGKKQLAFKRDGPKEINVFCCERWKSRTRSVCTCTHKLQAERIKKKYAKGTKKKEKRKIKRRSKSVQRYLRIYVCIYIRKYLHRYVYKKTKKRSKKSAESSC